MAIHMLQAKRLVQPIALIMRCRTVDHEVLHRRLRVRAYLTSSVLTVLCVQAGGADVVVNSLTSPGMVAASLATLRLGGRFVEIGKRGILGPAAVAAARPDVSYQLVAIDFLEPSAVGRAMVHIVAAVANGRLGPLPLARYGLSQAQPAVRLMSQVSQKLGLTLPRPLRLQPSQRGAWSLFIYSPLSTWYAQGPLAGTGSAWTWSPEAAHGACHPTGKWQYSNAVCVWRRVHTSERSSCRQHNQRTPRLTA